MLLTSKKGRFEKRGWMVDLVCSKLLFWVGVSWETNKWQTYDMWWYHLTPDSRSDSWYSIGQETFLQVCLCVYVITIKIWFNIKFWRNSYFNIFHIMIFACRMLPSSISCIRHDHTPISHHFQVQGLRKSLEEHWRLSNWAKKRGWHSHDSVMVI